MPDSKIVPLLVTLILSCATASTAQEPPNPPDPTPGTAPPTAASGQTGGWRLAEEASAYLRMHATNPVEWYPWSDEAFALARELDRPVFLSIGYASCHWCHVMRRESFEDDAIARYLNEHFISIKIDREELPHIDSVYMDFVQATRGRGGWPMSVFLTPDRVPFFGGTYFPPRGQPGRPGFEELLELIVGAWQNPDQRQRLLAQGDRIRETLAAREAQTGSAIARREFIELGLEHYRARYDSRFGGFGPAPKFPAPRALTFLCAVAVAERREDLREMVVHTLRSMARGGLFDAVGGGFHRYSVDERWAVPHFEKMLYSQGLLAEAYLEAHRMTGEADLADIARETLDSMLRDFAVERGGLAASWDADSEEEEGTYYVWTPSQVTALLEDEETRDWSLRYLGITEQGNFEGGRSVPSRPFSFVELAAVVGSSPEVVEHKVRAGMAELLAARSGRVAPFKDEKVILGWNATAASALARAASILDEPRYAVAAERILAYVHRRLAPEPGFLRRVARDHADHPALLLDAALLAKASLDLYEVGFDPRHVARARELIERIFTIYGAPDGAPARGLFFDTVAGAEVLLPRRQRVTDSALPSGNATLARVLIRLHGLTGETRYRELAEGIIEAATARLREYPQAAPEMLLATLMVSHPLPEVAVVGDLEDPSTRALLRAATRGHQPFAVIAHRPLGDAGQRAAQIVPLLRDRETVEGKPTAHLCFDFTCLAPRTDPEPFAEELVRAWRRDGTPPSDDATRNPEGATRIPEKPGRDD